MIARPNIHDRSRLSRIRNLPKPRRLDGAAQAEVADQPVLLESVVFNMLAESPSCEAVAPVRANGKAGSDRYRRAILVDTPQCDRLRILLDLGYRNALADLNGGQ